MSEEEEGRDEFDAEATLPKQASIAPRKSNPVEMSAVSKKLDVEGKGYLDDVQKAMRKYDVNNDGNFDITEVYKIVQEIQLQQQKTLETEHKYMNMRKAVIGLSVFAVILALANLGTAFAAAILAKDTSVGEDGVMRAKGSDRPVATENFVPEAGIGPPSGDAEGGSRVLSLLEGRKLRKIAGGGMRRKLLGFSNRRKKDQNDGVNERDTDETFGYGCSRREYIGTIRGDEYDHLVDDVRNLDRVRFVVEDRRGTYRHTIHVDSSYLNRDGDELRVSEDWNIACDSQGRRQEDCYAYRDIFYFTCDKDYRDYECEVEMCNVEADAEDVREL